MPKINKMSRSSFMLSEVPYRIEVVYHDAHSEYEAVIPTLGRGLFTAAAATKEEAISLLLDSYQELIYWYVREARRPLPPPDFPDIQSESRSKAQPTEVGLSCIL